MVQRDSGHSALFMLDLLIAWNGIYVLMFVGCKDEDAASLTRPTQCHYNPLVPILVRWYLAFPSGGGKRTAMA